MSRTLTRRTRSLRSGTGRRVIDRLWLRVIDGNDAGVAVPMEETTAVVGTRADCHLVLTDRTVSGQHVSFERFEDRVRVRDLGSKNGTRYLGARVLSVDVQAGATLELGNTRLALVPEAVAQDAVSDRSSLEGLQGQSVAMRRLFAQIERVAGSEASVLIEGETGTGKELVAQALHKLSPRAAGPFRVVRCAGLEPELVQSTLFGHVRGAFTGALKDVQGELELADGGTLVLDEVGELGEEVQRVLLRALEARTFSRVGEHQMRRSDFRLIATCRPKLEARVGHGFRLDLFHRLASVTLKVAPLRERLDDVPILVDHFAKALGAQFKFSARLSAPLAAYQWPGNVRELRNVVQRGLALGPASMLPATGAGTGEREPADFHEAREAAVRAFEQSYLRSMLKRHGGSVSAAAKEAKVARSYFYKLLEAHRIAIERKTR